MSGGRFNYLQTRYEWDEAIETINMHIKENPDEYDEDILLRFKLGLYHIEVARIYLQRIDWLLSGDDGDGSFKKRLKEDLDELRENF